MPAFAVASPHYHGAGGAAGAGGMMVGGAGVGVGGANSMAIGTGGGGVIAGGMNGHGGAGLVGGPVVGGGLVAGGGGAVVGGTAGGSGIACGCGSEGSGSAMLSYVGTGHGDYIQETTYRYVGAGAGEFEVLQVKPASKLWMFIGGGIAVLLLVLLLVLLMTPGGPTTTTTPAPTALPYDCAAGISNWQKGWSISKKAWCCDNKQKGCMPKQPAKKCTLWGDPHIIAFDQPNEVKAQALSFYGDGDFWLVKGDQVSIQGRFEGTKFTEGLAATNQVVVGGAFLKGHKIEVGTQQSGIVTVDGQAVFSSFPAAAPYKAADGSFTVTYNSQGEVPDVVPEGNEKRIVRMTLPLGIKVDVFQWFNYVDVTITMAPQVSQDGVCGNFNGNQGDDTTQTIMQRIGARVQPSQSFLSGQAKIDFTHQMKQMFAAECPAAKQLEASAHCTTNLGELVSVTNILDSCKFDYCFGMNVRARSHAKLYH